LVGRLLKYLFNLGAVISSIPVLLIMAVYIQSSITNLTPPSLSEYFVISHRWPITPIWVVLLVCSFLPLLRLIVLFWNRRHANKPEIVQNAVMIFALRQTDARNVVRRYKRLNRNRRGILPDRQYDQAYP